MCKKAIIVILLSAVIWHARIPGQIFAKTGDTEVVFKQNVSLRSLAKTYLGNSNEWETILFYNGFRHPSELQSDVRLIIPAGVFERTVKTLKKADEISRLANLEGAGVLAKDIIGKAAVSRNKAMALKKKGKLEDAEKVALKAVALAKKALAKARRKKIQSVSAILERKEKTVQSRRPDQPVWIDAVEDQELVEKERIRTLAASEAGVLFIDGSRIHMDENSLAVIGEMKENMIKNTFRAGVLVLQGDVLAHISSLGRKDFTITSPGIGTNVRSRKFRTSRDLGKVTRIANYDGEIDVRAGNDTVTVKKDEGTKIEYGRKPETPRKLLPPPIFTAPTENQTFFSPAIRFEWEKVEGAGMYKLEVGTDRKFENIVERVESTETRIDWKIPDKGVYYCRIHTVDRDKFSGPFSDPIGFYADMDVLPPYLAVSSPIDGEVLLSGEVLVRGATERNAKIMIDNRQVDIDENGVFNCPVKIEPGEQTVTIVAADHAGNQSIIRRKVVRDMGELISLDTPVRMTVNSNQVAIRGKTRPHTKVEIDGEPVGSQHGFSHILNLAEGEHTVTVKATSSIGETRSLPVTIRVDLTPPKIVLDDHPKFTRKSETLISGKFSEPAVFSLNGAPSPSKLEMLELTVKLEEGENVFELGAEDEAGNTSARTVRIIRDTNPPEIGKYSCSPPRTDGGHLLSCRVSAADGGIGLARTGGFSVSVFPHNVFKGVLTLNRMKNMYEGGVFISPGVKGKVEIKDIRIQDRLGNEAIWQ